MPQGFSLCGVRFSHPEPIPQKIAIFPVFLPFSGCVKRCVFCAQETQSGRPQRAVECALAEAGRQLSLVKSRAESRPELAFFGGTFTALSAKERAMCLEFYSYWRNKGVVQGLRCSTRPDAVNLTLLGELREKGMTTVELGVQTFSSDALARSGRGYDAETAIAAANMVRNAGMTLGLQLMPGMPGVTPETARRDMERAVGLRPRWLRLYPCLVLANTDLEAWWRQGRYEPWEFSETLSFLADACLEAWRMGVRVIRMGLAPEDDLKANVLAGPWHPSLGSMARGLALARYLKEKIGETGLAGARLCLWAPRRFQGEFWGYKGNLAAFYESQGLGRKNIRWHQGNDFVLTKAEGDSE